MDLTRKVLVATLTILIVASLSISGESISDSAGSMTYAPPSMSPSTRPYVTTFQIQNTSSDPSPWLLYPARDGTVWVVTIKLGRQLVSQITKFTLVTPTSGVSQIIANLSNTVPTEIVYDNNSGLVWMLENENLAYYNESTKSIVIAQSFHNASPQYLAIDSQDRMWLTMLNSSQVVEYNPSGQTLNIYPTPTANAGLQGITVSRADGSIWFVEAYAGKIGHLIPCSSSKCHIDEYSPPSGLSLQGVIQVAVDRTGIVWFTIHDGNEFGSFDPSTGDWKLFPIGYCLDSNVAGCEVGLPNALSLDSSGNVWFAEHYAGRVARYDPVKEALVEYVIPNTSALCSKSCSPLSWWMWPGSQNLVWFTAFGLGEIGYVNSTLPVPFNLSPQQTVTIEQGGSSTFPISSSYATTAAPSMNASITTQDSSSTPSKISFTIGPTNANSSAVSATLTLLAGYNATLGARFVAITAYDPSIAVNTFVQVVIIPCMPHLWSCTNSLGLYATLGFAGVVSGISAATLGFIFFRTKRRKNSTELVEKS